MSLDLVGPFTVQVGEYPNTDAELITSPVQGVITDVGLKYTFDEGSSLDIDIVTGGNVGPAQDVLHLSGSNTDGWYHPRVALQDTNGGDLTGQNTNGIPVYDTVSIAISNGGAGDRLDVWFILQT